MSARHPHAAWLDPDSGKLTRVAATGGLPLELAAYEGCVLVLSDRPLQAADTPWLGSAAVLADLSQDWTLTLPAAAGPGAGTHDMTKLHSWTDSEASRYFSGIGVYKRDVTLDAPRLEGQRVVLDFGPG